jgi:hypothetical protein
VNQNRITVPYAGSLKPLEEVLARVVLQLSPMVAVLDRHGRPGHPVVSVPMDLAALTWRLYQPQIRRRARRPPHAATRQPPAAGLRVLPGIPRDLQVLR